MYIKLPYDHNRDNPLVNNKKGRSSKSRNILRKNGPDQYKKTIHTHKPNRPKANWTNCSHLGPALKGHALELYTLGCSSTQQHIACLTVVGPVPPKAGNVHKHIRIKPRTTRN